MYVNKNLLEKDIFLNLSTQQLNDGAIVRTMGHLLNYT